jgi:Caspase domain
MAENRSIGGLPNSPFETIKQGKNYLFAIGINNYQHFNKLSNASKDIQDLANILKEQFDFVHQEILLDEDATRSNIINKLNDLPEKVAPEDKLLIFYSGHGKLEEHDIDKQRGYWIPVDAKEEDRSSYVSNAELRDILKMIKARHILLISDSCFSASIFPPPGRAAESFEGAYEDMERSRSRWGFISGKGVVSDGDVGANSPFATGIIRQLKKADDMINISLLADRVTKDISLNYDQQAIAKPLFGLDGEDGGQFVFVKKQTEKDEWESALRHNTEGSYWEYKNKYPNGKFVKEAKQKLKDIGDGNAWAAVLNRDAAYDYSDYLDKYPDGNHADEARSKLNEIAREDRLKKENIQKQQELEQSIENENATKKKELEKQEVKDKEKARRIEQEQIFQAEKARKEKELLPQSKPVNKLDNPSTSKKDAPAYKNSESNIPKSKSNLVRYLFILGFAGVLIAGGTFWYQNRVKPDQVIPPKPVVISPVTDISFDIDGDVVDAANKNKLSGITVLNTRNKNSTVSDPAGHFKMAATQNGDTIILNDFENDQYLGTTFIIKDNIKSSVIDIQEKPRVKENKTISGNVQDNKGMVTGAFVKVIRNGYTVKITSLYGVKTDRNGNYSLPHVNEGNVLSIDYGKGRKASKIVNRENIYNLIENKIVSSPASPLVLKNNR